MSECNIRASRYFVLEALHECRKCKQATRVVALAVPPGHEDIEGGSRVEQDDDSPGVSAEDFHDWLFAPDQWYQVNSPAMISSVAGLSDTVAQHMQRVNVHYFQDKEDGGYWSNHCEHCGAAVFDGHLYSRTGDPFAPSDLQAAHRLQVNRVDAPFEAFYRMCWSPEYADKHALFARLQAADSTTP